MGRDGKSAGECVKYQGKWITPSEFAKCAGITARKWKQSVRFNDKPIGTWIELVLRQQHQLQIFHTSTIVRMGRLRVSVILLMIFKYKRSCPTLNLSLLLLLQV